MRAERSRSSIRDKVNLESTLGQVGMEITVALPSWHYLNLTVYAQSGPLLEINIRQFISSSLNSHPFSWAVEWANRFRSPARYGVLDRGGHARLTLNLPRFTPVTSPTLYADVERERKSSREEGEAEWRKSVVLLTRLPTNG